jgi:hypothetical protein
MALKNLLVALTAGLAAAVAYAQAPLGTVSNVNGVVTATQGATGMTVAPGTVIQNGMRFVTTTNGSVTLNLNSGCTVTVPAGHGVTVLQSMTCQQLTAAVQPLVPVATGPAFPPNPALVNGIILAGAAGSLIAGFKIVLDNDESLSAR